MFIIHREISQGRRVIFMFKKGNFREIVACVAGVEGEEKEKKQGAKRAREGDAFKDAIVFFILPPN